MSWLQGRQQLPIRSSDW